MEKKFFGTTYHQMGTTAFMRNAFIITGNRYGNDISYKLLYVWSIINIIIVMTYTWRRAQAITTGTELGPRYLIRYY